MNYIVSENEVQNNTDVIQVNGKKFVISGADVDFNGNKGIEIQDNNKSTIIGTSMINSDGTTITAKGKTNVEIDAKDKDITISSINTVDVITLKEDSSLTLFADENEISIKGSISGLNNPTVPTDNRNNVTTEGNYIYLEGLKNINLAQNADKLIINGNVLSSTLDLNNGYTAFARDSYLSNDTNSLNLSGGALSISNNEANDIKLASMKLNSDTDLYIDIDLSKLASDKFVFNNSDDVTVNSGLLNIQNVNIVNSKTGLTNSSYKIPFVSSEYNNTNLANNVIASSLLNKNILTPIYKYSLNFETDNERVYFSLNRLGNPSNWRDLNSSILASPVAAQVGGYLTQLNNYEQAFQNMDMLMIMPKNQRKAIKYANKYAYNNTQGMTFSPNQIPEETRGLWFKPYATFEKVGLKNGPNVENIAYGTLFGGDSDIIELKRGWNMIWSVYSGYTGSHQNYEGNSIYQNGGLIGISSLFYKNNFFSGLTANVGASVGNASTMYGEDNFAMLSTGIASKSGYNFEFKNSKFIIQPSWLMSYSFINTFDYTTASGVKIDSSGLNAIQLSPQLKFIGKF